MTPSKVHLDKFILWSFYVIPRKFMAKRCIKNTVAFYKHIGMFRDGTSKGPDKN